MDPIGQDWHDIPSTVYVLIAQGVQDEDPWPVATVPGVQDEQEKLASLDVKVPGGHCEQEVDPIEICEVPAGHGVHDAEPSVDE